MRKQFILFTVMLSLVLMACNKGEEKQADIQSSSYNRETDDQPYWGGLKTAVSTKYGYYFLIGKFLYLYDSQSQQIIPVCGRADCRHDRTGDCNAYFDEFIDFIGYYNGCLYMVGQPEKSKELNLYQVTADGSKRTKLCQLGLLDADDAQGISFMSAVHRGYLYYSIVTSEPVPSNRKAAAYRISLTDGKYAKEEIWSREGLGASVFGFWAYDNTVLFASTVLEEGNLSGSSYSFSEYEYSYYDITRETVIENILHGSDEDTDTIYVSGDRIYCCKEDKFFSISLTDASTEEIESDIFKGELPHVSYDFKNLYCQDYATGTITVYDTEQFQKIKEIEADPLWQMLFGDESFLFAIDEDDSLYVYDKKKDDSWMRIENGMEKSSL